MELILAAESLEDGIKRRQKVEARSQDVQAGDIEPKQRKDTRTYIWERIWEVKAVSLVSLDAEGCRVVWEREESKLTPQDANNLSKIDKW